MLRCLPVALCLVLLTAASASAVSFFCGDYGYRCYRPYTPRYAPTTFLDDLWGNEGEYVGSLRVEQGVCRKGFKCKPCDDVRAFNQEPAGACNERFPECSGECFAK